jgi:hypothetical protein
MTHVESRTIPVEHISISSERPFTKSAEDILYGIASTTLS